MYYFVLYRAIIKDLCQHKVVHVTATTGMARLQYSKGFTIHSWSGLKDGRLSVNEVIHRIKNDANYTSTRDNIITCQVLIIDEISMCSKQTLENVEKICR